MDYAKRVLTTGEAAKWCGVSLITVLRWIRKGRLKAYSLPGRGDHRIRMEDFMSFLCEHRIPALKPLGERRVLVVDDDPSAARFISETLHDLGYTTKQAPDGFAAGSQLFAFAPDLVTLDLAMPGLGGHQVIEFIRASEQIRHTKILVISDAPPAKLRRALSQGADGTLRKPLDRRSLERKVAELFKASGKKAGRKPAARQDVQTAEGARKAEKGESWR